MFFIKKKNEKGEVEKIKGNHVYERDVDFNEYYDFFKNERKKYQIIIDNLMDFEIHFKSITAYHILTFHKINDSEQLALFLDTLKLQFSVLNTRYNEKRISHMNHHIEYLLLF